MSLIELKPNQDIIIDLAYATEHNINGKKIYQNARCFVHQDAMPAINKIIELIKPFGLRLKIFDAYRPRAAQFKFWEICPDPRYVADPNIGSIHSKGVAIDINLVDAEGNDLDMGTPFDDFTELAHHGNTEVSLEAQKNRWFLAGIMAYSGWRHYDYEWWHYNLAGFENYGFIDDPITDKLIMES